MDQAQLLALYRVMLASRRIDTMEQELTRRGEAFFHVSSAGHEAMAVLASYLTDDDWLHPYYRDRALLLARGVPIKAFFDNLFCKHDAPGRGRRMSPFLADPKLKLLSMVAPTANNALQSTGVAAAVKDRPGRPIVVCTAGDGTSQQGEFLEACSQAVRDRLPVLFIIEDNRWAISTPTRGRTFFSLPDGPAAEFLGMPIHNIDGRDAIAAHDALAPIVAQMRSDRRPAVVVFDVERLDNHTNADDQSIYRDAEDIRRSRTTGDPIINLRRKLLQQGVTQQTLEAIAAEVEAEIVAAEAASYAGDDPQPILTAKRPLRVELTHPSRERRGSGPPELTMKDAINRVLLSRLRDDARVSLLGEDIEDPKGDVFGVTKGLSTRFPGRVCNSALSESTIVGVSIGRALAGERPVAFIQFADFLPLAFNQIAAELGSMHWRSDGAYEAPVIIMAACGGYRPGLGPYHAQTNESICVHTPGVDVFMPSTAVDAAGLLNAVFESGRPTLFLYPKSCLNDRSRAAPNDVEQQFVPIGPARKARVGRDITFVGWGNTVALCEKTADALEKAGIESEVLDLRSLSPWDEHTVLASAEKTARLLVVHEDNHTCGLGAEVLATVAEKTRVPVAVRRVTRPDTYIPCNFANQIEVLPSYKSVLTAAAELLNLDLSWIAPPKPEAGVAFVEAIGSGPSDETVTIVELAVQPGQHIERGDTVASLEATKSVFELTSPVTGVLEEILAAEGDVIEVGQPLLRLRTGNSAQRSKPISQEDPGEPVLSRRRTAGTIRLSLRGSEHRAFDVGVSSVASVAGSRLVSNAELLKNTRAMTGDDILRRTGIESRHWAAEGENAVNMAVKACWQVLDKERLIVDDIDLLICSTTSPNSVTPSMACQVLNGLAGGKTDAMIQAYDINAACSGYLYALQAGYDYLQSTPHGRVLVVTAEVLSPLLDPADFDTAILFGDATSATVLYGESCFENAQARLYRPELSAKGEDGSSLSVPFRDGGFIQMKGRKVFSEAVRTMIASLTRVCQKQGMTVDDLHLVVPHQANQRILDAIQNRIRPSVYSNIRHNGNTSSTSIPLCLTDVLPRTAKGDRVGLAAFGGGFTFGAGILEAI